MHRSEYKKKSTKTDRERRREALESSRSADRSALFAALRSLAEEPSEKKSLTDNIIYPDVLVEIPENFRSEWQVQLRPAGRRVIASIREGRLSLKSAKHGNFIAQFPINQSLLRLGRLTVLDGVLDEIGNFFVLDVLVWDAAEISECETEFRHFWLKSRFSEFDLDSVDSFSSTPTGADGAIGTADGIGTIDGMDISKGKKKKTIVIKQFKYMEPMDATPDNIFTMYECKETNFQTDSLMFMHKSAIYQPGLSPLYLQWRDGKICKFPIDTGDASGQLIPRRQAVVLRAKRRGSRVVLKTWDGVKLAEFDEMAEFPIVFGVDEASFLVRGFVDDVVDSEDGARLVNLGDMQRVTSVRVLPDSLARIRSQAHFRKFGQPIVTIEHLCSS